jgi:NSS family neurotransmitter:Na+ symporter
MINNREHWGSKLGFILAASGSAIGLGNIWKFPYIAGENGGAAFVFVYLLCIAVIGMPVLIAEILMGRTTQRNPVGAFRKLSGKPFWTFVGGMGVIAGFIILSYYTVVAGWTIGYIVESFKGAFEGFAQASHAEAHFNDLVGNVGWMMGYYTLFFLLVMGVVYMGVKSGIERGSKIMMPILFFILITLVIRGITLPGSTAGLQFLFNPQWDKITGQTVLLALGHAFFTLSLGMGAMMTYGSYLSKKDNIPNSSLQILSLDTIIAILAGIAIFTAVFAMSQNPEAGPGLIFHAIPVVFANMPGGYFFSILFFILLGLAALTSAISLLEVITAFFVDELGWKRHTVVVTMGTVVYLVGAPSALSYNLLSDFTILGLSFFDLADYIAANILLPLGGLSISVFVAWIWGFDKALLELKKGAESLFKTNLWTMNTWKYSLKYIAPILIFIVFLESNGLLSTILGNISALSLFIFIAVVILLIVVIYQFRKR